MTLAAAWFVVTAYCACFVCTGHKTPQNTARNLVPMTQWTAACDPAHTRKLKRVVVPGLGALRCEDTGSAIKDLTTRDGRRIVRLDVFMASHEEAKRFGVRRIRGRIEK